MLIINNNICESHLLASTKRCYIVLDIQRFNWDLLDRYAILFLGTPKGEFVFSQTQRLSVDEPSQLPRVKGDLPSILSVSLMSVGKFTRNPIKLCFRLHYIT